MFRQVCRCNRCSHLSCIWMHQGRALGYLGTKTSSVNRENPLRVLWSFNLPNSLPYYGTEKQVLAFLIRVMQQRQMFNRFLKPIGMFQFWAKSLLSQSQITFLLCKSVTHTHCISDRLLLWLHSESKFGQGISNLQGTCSENKTRKSGLFYLLPCSILNPFFWTLYILCKHIIISNIVHIRGKKNIIRSIYT